MRKFFLLLALCGLPSAARQVTPDEALSRAVKSRTAACAPSARPASAKYDFAGRYGSLYVFNRADSEGYLITSSDTRLRPVYAVSASGSFEADRMPPAMEWMLSLYEAEAALAAEGGETSGVPDYYVDWKPVSPMVSAKWDQGSPYNDRCPVVYNQKTLTGCVATAMAQIVYTHRYAKGSGQISYQLFADNSVQTFDFSKAEFNFSVMTDTYGSGSSAAARAAVAELMEACGKSVKMSYFPGSSAAISNDVPDALVNYFGYDPYTAVCNRWDYGTEQWETIIYKELTAGRPVYYSGSTEGGGGHAFVCDGYDGNGLFHINWGWSGMSNGYFALPTLKPGQVGTGAEPGGFSCVQQMVVIAPPGSADLQDLTPWETAGEVDMLVSDVEISPLYAGDDATVTFTAVNRGRADLNTTFARLLLYRQGQIVAYGDEVRSYTVPAGDARRATFRMVLVDDKGKNIPTGDYELRICDQDDRLISGKAAFAVTVVSGEHPKDEEFVHSGQVSVGDARESIPGIILRNDPFHLTPSVRNDNAYASFFIGLALFEPGTDNIVWSTLQSLTCQNTNGAYIPGFPYLKNYTVTAPAGVYDAAFIGRNRKIISARREGVRVAEEVSGLVFAPTVGGAGASLVPAAYSGDIVVPESVTFSEGTVLPVVSIDSEAFQDLGDLRSVDLPATIDSVGLHALRYTRGLEILRFRGDKVPFVNVAAIAYRMNPRVRIYVNESAFDDYAAALAPFVPTAYIRVSEIRLDPTGLTLREKETAQLSAVAAPDHATCKDIVWASSNPAVATVDAGGLVKALAPGKAVITASADEVKATCTVTVEVSSGIEEIGAAAGEAPLYDLSGRLVAAPSRGRIYISAGRKVVY